MHKLLERKETDQQDLVDKLKEKHPEMENVKLRLWDKIIHSGHHDNYDTPPNTPLITGKDVGNSKKTAKEGVASVVAEAATAIVKACKPPSFPVQSSDCSSGKEISPIEGSPTS